MAEGQLYPYASLTKSLWQGGINLLSDSLYVSLHAAYTPNFTAHEDFADVSATEVSLTGYTAGGQALTGVTLTWDGTNMRWVLDADNPLWASLQAGTVSHAIVRKFHATPASSWLIGYIPIIATQPNGNNFSLTLPASGLLTSAVTPRE